MNIRTAGCALSMMTALLLATPAFAEIQPQTSNGTTYVSGGIGADEQSEMQALKPKFPVHLLFAEKGNGAYLSDVGVTIKDKEGRTVLDAVAQGPFLYANLAPGTYQVTATFAGKAQNQTISLHEGSATEARFYWQVQS